MGGGERGKWDLLHFVGKMCESTKVFSFFEGSGLKKSKSCDSSYLILRYDKARPGKYFCFHLTFNCVDYLPGETPISGKTC